MDITFGVDVSHHKPGFDFKQAAREGIAFAALKATEGDSFTDGLFNGYLRAARAAGLLVIAYHYQLATAPAAGQVRHVLRAVPADVPLAVDVEARSGEVALTRDLVDQLRRAGRRVVLTYLPRWYWTQLGRPDLTGLPPLWSSRYPDNVVGSVADEWHDVPAAYWHGYGGLTVALLQFTSSAALANYPAGAIDANAYRGTRDELAALLGGGQEDDMFDDGDRRKLDRILALVGGDWDPSKVPDDGLDGSIAKGIDVLEQEVQAVNTKVDSLTALPAPRSPAEPFDYDKFADAFLRACLTRIAATTHKTDPTQADAR